MFRANVRHCPPWNIVLLSYNLTVACHICVQPMVDYIGFTRTVGVVWVCRHFEYSHSCRRFDLSPFDHRP